MAQPPHRTNGNNPLFVNQRRVSSGPPAPRTTSTSTPSNPNLPPPSSSYPPRPSTSTPASRLPQSGQPPTASAPEAAIDLLLRRFVKLYSTLSLEYHPGEVVLPPSIDPEYRAAYVAAEKKRSEVRHKQVQEQYATMTNGIAKLLRELVGELPTGGSDVVGLKAAVERLGEENRALGEEKGALERSVEEIRRAQEGMANEFREAQKMAESRMEARLALLERKQEPTTDPRRRPSESPAPFAVVPPLPQVVEMEERLKGFAAEMGKVEVALSEVGRKRKAEGGTLWEEVERMEKRMEGVEERDKDRIEKEREKELQEKEKDVEMKDLVDPISDFKDRLAFIENEIKALPPPRSVTPDLEKKEAVASIINIKDRLAAVENEIKTLPVPPTPTPAPSPDSPQHPARLLESLQLLSTSIESVQSRLDNLSSTATTTTATLDADRASTASLHAEFKALQTAFEQLAQDVAEGKFSPASLEESFRVLRKNWERAIEEMRGKCDGGNVELRARYDPVLEFSKQVSPFLLATLPEIAAVCAEFRKQERIKGSVLAVQVREDVPAANGVEGVVPAVGAAQDVPMAGVVVQGADAQ